MQDDCPDRVQLCPALPMIASFEKAEASRIHIRVNRRNSLSPKRSMTIERFSDRVWHEACSNTCQARVFVTRGVAKSME